MLTLRGDLTTPDQSRSREKSAAVKAVRLQDIKVLAVDDSPDNLRLLNIFLTREGARVDQANSGEEAIRMASAAHYDVVLMDIQMPGIDGYETLARLKSLGLKSPVLALTAHAMKEERDRALAAGFNSHLAKPLDAAQLVESIASYMNSAT